MIAFEIRTERYVTGGGGQLGKYELDVPVMPQGAAWDEKTQAVEGIIMGLEELIPAESTVASQFKRLTISVKTATISLYI